MINAIVPVILEIIAYVEVEAESVQEAIELVESEGVHLSNYVGNGAMSGKLIGTSQENVTIEVTDDSNFQILEDAIEWDTI